MKKVIIVGIAADPPHLGHFEIVKGLMSVVSEIRKIILIPSGARADKQYHVDAKHRRAMIELIFGELVRVTESLEIYWDDIDRENTNSIVWFDRIMKEFPDDFVYWCVGMDLVFRKNGDLSPLERTWTDADKLVRDYRFMIVPRKGYPDPKTCRLYLQKYGVADIVTPDFSSTEVRTAIANGNDSCRQMVGDKAYEYIVENKLYL